MTYRMYGALIASLSAVAYACPERDICQFGESAGWRVQVGACDGASVGHSLFPASPGIRCGGLLAWRLLAGRFLRAIEWRTRRWLCPTHHRRYPLLVHLRLRYALGLGSSLSADGRAFRPGLCAELSR